MPTWILNDCALLGLKQYLYNEVERKKYTGMHNYEDYYGESLFNI